MMPTASAVVGDLIDVVVGRAGLTFAALDLWSETAPPPRLTPAEPGPEPVLPAVHDRRPAGRARRDRPGARRARDQHRQRDPARPRRRRSRGLARCPLVIMTHLAVEAEMTAALREIDRLDVVHAPSVCLGVEE